ncbi:MAG: S8 family serine peptidase [Pseudomonadota bacterium]
MRVLILVILTCILGACTGPRESEIADAQQWRMGDTTRMSSQQHVVLTVNPAEAATLSAMARRIEAEYGVELVAEWPLKAIDVHCFVVRISDDTDVDRLIDDMEEDASILTAYPMQQFSTLTSPAYDDKLFDLQDGLHSIGAPSVHGLVTGDRVRVGVIDTGIDVAHPDLRDGRVKAFDFVGASQVSPPAEVHGTAVAGVIAADAANGYGIVGVAPGAEIIGLRGCWQETSAQPGQCSTFTLARALNFALLQDLNILNLSLAGPYDPLIARLIDSGVARGMVIVAAAGRDGLNFPASQNGVIAVAASGAAARADVWAPGTDIISTVPGDRFDFFSGDSVAAAHVTGLSALMLQADPGLTPEKIRRSMQVGVHGAGIPPERRTIDTCSTLRFVLSEPQELPC